MEKINSANINIRCLDNMPKVESMDDMILKKKFEESNDDIIPELTLSSLFIIQSNNKQDHINLFLSQKESTFDHENIKHTYSHDVNNEVDYEIKSNQVNSNDNHSKHNPLNNSSSYSLLKSTTTDQENQLKQNIDNDKIGHLERSVMIANNHNPLSPHKNSDNDKYQNQLLNTRNQFNHVISEPSLTNQYTLSKSGDGRLTYNFNQWGDGHSVVINKTNNDDIAKIIFSPSDHIVQSRLHNEWEKDSRSKSWYLQEQDDESSEKNLDEKIVINEDNI